MKKLLTTILILGSTFGCDLNYVRNYKPKPFVPLPLKLQQAEKCLDDMVLVRDNFFELISLFAKSADLQNLMPVLLKILNEFQDMRD